MRTIISTGCCLIYLVAFSVFNGGNHLLAASFIVQSPTFALRKAQAMRLTMSMPNPLDTLTSGLASICRLPHGVTVSPSVITGKSSIIELRKLYDIENSKECRTVREFITEYDLVIEKLIPAAKNSQSVVNQSYLEALPEGQSVPCLVLKMEDGTEHVLSGEEKIVSFLTETFDASKALASKDEDESIVQMATALLLKIGYFTAGLLRAGRGSEVSPAAIKSHSPSPGKPLVLYSYEGNQFCRLVREVLTELDIVYELRSAGKGSPRRKELSEISGGSTQCPFLVDPNTGKTMSESAEIIQYLYNTYALWTPPSEILQWASKFVMASAKPIFGALAPLQAGSKSLEESQYQAAIESAKKEIEAEINVDSPVVVYTYELSPFSSETTELLRRMNVDFKEISLGKEWIPGLLAPGGAEKRAGLLEMTGQSSLPHIFIGGQPIGGLYSGNPGLLPMLESGEFQQLLLVGKGSTKEKSQEEFA